MSSNFNIQDQIVLNGRIIIKMEDATAKTKGGIILPEEYTKAEARARTQGELVAFAENAFEGWKKKPEIGDTIFFNVPYLGIVFNDEEGSQYRSIASKDLMSYQSSNINNK